MGTTKVRINQGGREVQNRDEKRYSVGVNYYPMSNNFNIKAGIGRAKPASGVEMTQFTLQLQVFYF